MIHYELRCSDDHPFDGWFRDSAAFETQARRGLIECPICGGTEVRRALMAPAVASAHREPVPDPSPVQPPRQARPPQPPAVPGPPAAPTVGAVGGPMPDQMRAMLQRMRSEVEKHCVYVGANFAEEARRMHRGESDRHGIYGETTPEQAEALAEDGIEFSRIPWVPRADG